MKKLLLGALALVLAIAAVPAVAVEGPEDDGKHRDLTLMVNPGTPVGDPAKDRTHFDMNDSPQASRDGWDYGDRAGYSCTYVEHFSDGVQDFSVHYELVHPYPVADVTPKFVTDGGGAGNESEARANCGVAEFEGDGGIGGDPRRASKAVFDDTPHFPHSVALVYYKDLDGDGLVTQSAADELNRIDYPTTCGNNYWVAGDEPGEAWLWIDDDGAADVHHHGDGICGGGPGEPYPAARVHTMEITEGVAVCTEALGVNLCEGIEDDPVTPVTLPSGVSELSCPDGSVPEMLSPSPLLVRCPVVGD